MEMKTANNEIRQKNRSAIFRLFLEQEGVSRQDLVDKLGLSLPTVTNNLQQLQQEGLITQTGTLGNTGGRRARLYSLESSARTAIGLEITRHHLTAVALDLRGTIIASKRRRLDFARTDSYYRELGSMVQQIVASAELKEESILGVGIGVPGLVTPDHREIFYGMVLGFTGASCEEFSKYIPYPTAFFHDTDAACFAEIWNDSGIRNVFYIMLSASVGGAIYLGGKQYGGTNLRAGEVGHLTAVPNGRQCYCGRRGCVDSYCAASVLSSAANGDLKRFFQQLREGDPATETIWQEYVGHLASAVANIRMLFDCDIIIGGYVGSYIDAHMGDLKKALEDRTTFDENPDYLRPCRYKTEAIATGAALNYISAFLDSI